MQWSGKEEDIPLVFEQLGDFSVTFPSDGVHVMPGLGYIPSLGTLDIPTPDGRVVTACHGEWLVWGKDGTFCVVSPLIFNVLYEKKLPYKGRRVGKLLVTTCRQPTGSPFVDDGWAHDQEGNDYNAKVIVWPFGNKNKYGDRNRRRGFVVGWRKGK